MRLLVLIKKNWQWWLMLAFVVLLPTKNLSNVSVGMMTIAGLVMLVRRDPRLPCRRNLVFLFALFACIWLPMLAALPGATNLEHAVITTLKYFRFVFMGVFVLVALQDERARRYVLWGVFLITLFWCIDALWQFISGENFFGHSLHRQRISGIFHPRYRLGVVLAAFAPLYLELVRQLMQRSWTALLLVPPIMTVIVLSGSRAAWLMLIVGLVFYAGYLLATIGSKVLLSARGLVTCLLVVVTTIVAVHHFPPTARRAQEVMDLFSSDLETIDAATKRRVSIWIPAIDIVEENWLNGIGPRGFRYQFLKSADPDNFWMKREPPGVTHPHLHVLEVATETGVIGLFGYLLFFVMLIRLLRRSWMTASTLAPVLACSLVSLFPLNAHLSFYGSFWSSICWWLVFLCLAIHQGDASGQARKMSNAG